MKLDRTRPYGDVFGDHPARYEQDGLFFNVAEEQIDGEGNLVESAPKASKKSKTPAPVKEDAPAEVEDQLSAQLLEPVSEFE